MNPIRIAVSQRKGGYVAESTNPRVTALGAKPVDAAENARAMAAAILERHAWPATLLLNIKEPGRSTIVMQPFDQPVSLTVDDDADWRYVSSETSEPATEIAKP
jgi:hypothetical protein